VTFKTPGLSCSSAPHSLQESNVSPFHFPTMADSAAFCTETTTGHHDRFSMQPWFRSQSVVVFSTSHILDVLHPQLLRGGQMCCLYVHSRLHHTHFFVSSRCSGDCLCGLVARVSGYSPGDPGYDSRRSHIFLVVVCLRRSPFSLVSINEEVL
jgi:hypothetical protein